MVEAAVRNRQRIPDSESNPVVYRSLCLSISSNVSEMSSIEWNDTKWSEMTKINGVITEVTDSGVWIQISPSVRGFCHRMDLSTDLEELKQYQRIFAKGKSVEANVITINVEKKQLDLSLIASPPLSLGTVLYGMVTTKAKVVHPPSLMVSLPGHCLGRVCITEVNEKADWVDSPLGRYQHGDIFEMVVIKEDTVPILSLRASRIGNSVEEVKFPAVGDLVQGYVTVTGKQGCFLRLGYQLEGRVLLRDLSDTFIKSPETIFPCGRLVAGRVMKVNEAEQQISISLKASVVTPETGQLTLSTLTPGMHVKGTISNIQKYGIFVNIENSNRLSGLCHISEMTDESITSTEGVYAVGDYVKAKVLKVENGRIALGLKASYFEDDESSEEESGDNEVAESNDEAKSSDNESNDDMKVETEVEPVPENNDNEWNEESGDEAKSTKQSVGFSWDGFDIGTTKEDEDISDSDTDEPVQKRRKHKNKLAELKNEEEEIRQREKRLMNGEALPETADEYERLLVASPNNSYLWIKYMSFQLSISEIDLARDVAERALKSIDFRDQKEKLNVWVAYMNLEKQYGDDSQLSAIFDRALQHNNPKKVYLHLVDIYLQQNEMEDAKTTLMTLCKKFKHSKQAWLAYLKFELEHGKIENAKTILEKALKSLAKHKHVTVISKFAMLEYEMGSIERARTIFEGITAAYPKRLDLWNIYLDKEIKYGSAEDQEYIRNLFQRLIHMKFSAHKIKFLFKKYLQYETEYGTEASVEHVKELVNQYIESSN